MASGHARRSRPPHEATSSAQPGHLLTSSGRRISAECDGAILANSGHFDDEREGWARCVDCPTALPPAAPATSGNMISATRSCTSLPRGRLGQPRCCRGSSHGGHGYELCQPKQWRRSRGRHHGELAHRSTLRCRRRSTARSRASSSRHSGICKIDVMTKPSRPTTQIRGKRGPEQMTSIVDDEQYLPFTPGVRHRRISDKLTS